jgi:hypothetical protein
VTKLGFLKGKAALRRPFNKKLIAASGQSSRLALPPIGHVADADKARIIMNQVAGSE